MCIATVAGGWRLTGMAPYRGIPFEITKGIYFPRLLWAQYKGGCVYRGLISGIHWMYVYI
jgi:hypothetical protein